MNKLTTKYHKLATVRLLQTQSLERRTKWQM
nr:MAG TPA: hypothetical protein [Caudoviricetes sp.]